jgi:hypothetical protein
LLRLKIQGCAAWPLDLAPSALSNSAADVNNGIAPARLPTGHQTGVVEGRAHRASLARRPDVPHSLGGTDLVVFHPHTRYEHGRPTWLSLGGRRQPHAIKTDLRPAADALYLAQAFYAHEQGPNAVPIDQIAYSADEPLPTLWLPEGKFRIRIIDESGKTLGENSMAGR